MSQSALRFQKKTPDPQHHERELQQLEYERQTSVHNYWIDTYHDLSAQAKDIRLKQYELEQIYIPRELNERQLLDPKERELLSQPPGTTHFNIEHALPKPNTSQHFQQFTYPPPPPLPTIPTPDQDLFHFFDLYPLIIQSGIYIEQSLAPEHSLSKAILPDVTINNVNNIITSNAMKPSSQLIIPSTTTTHIVIEPELHPDLTHTGVVHEEFGKLLQKTITTPSTITMSASSNTITPSNKTSSNERFVIDSPLPTHIPSAELFISPQHPHHPLGTKIHDLFTFRYETNLKLTANTSTAIGSSSTSTLMSGDGVGAHQNKRSNRG